MLVYNFFPIALSACLLQVCQRDPLSALEREVDPQTRSHHNDEPHFPTARYVDLELQILAEPALHEFANRVRNHQPWKLDSPCTPEAVDGRVWSLLTLALMDILAVVELLPACWQQCLQADGAEISMRPSILDQPLSGVKI